jgi:7-cyano-7-deazaguanine reductase
VIEILLATVLFLADLERDGLAGVARRWIPGLRGPARTELSRNALDAEACLASNSLRMSKSAKSKKTHLTLLGKSVSAIPAAPTAATLETFPNAYARRDYWIRFESADFTSLCPVTGQPDFASITVDYVPDKICIETKSFKFYLASFRNTRRFNEEIVNRILEDLVEACAPRHLWVHGEFASRGGIGVTVEAFHPATALRRPGGRGSSRRGA